MEEVTREGIVSYLLKRQISPATSLCWFRLQYCVLSLCLCDIIQIQYEKAVCRKEKIWHLTINIGKL